MANFRDVQLATPRIADAYAKVSAATLQRDLQMLWEKDRLIDIKRGIVRPRKELIESFLPDRAEG
jgi:DeoR/GlpR family transcriptional regulator of sugar metabolism